MTISQHGSNGHIVAVSLPMWGHTKSLCALLIRAVQLHRVHATIFTDAVNHDKVLSEVSRAFPTTDSEGLESLIRVVALRSSPVPYQFDVYMSAFIEAYKYMYQGNAIPITPDSDEVYEPVSTPKLVVVDFFCFEILKGIRSISGHLVPVYAWQSGSATAVLYLYGPETLGGGGDMAEKLRKITTEDPERRAKEVQNVIRRLDQKLVTVPGLQPMYEYEHVPQIAAIPVDEAAVATITQYNHRLFEECDGVVQATSSIFEGEALKKWQEWYGTRPVIAVGPISPPANAEDIEMEKSKSPVGGEVEAFLSTALDKHGPNSVVYISFGTVWWSSQPEKIWTFIDVLLELGIPFLFSHASPVAVVPEEVISKVEASGLGYVAKWLPQQMILQHKACGWFVTHCGHNSVMESLTAGVPLICWPYDADQPTNAANISFVHEAGYELFEVRTGHGLRPVHRLGDKAPRGTLEAVRQEAIELFAKARGKDGEAKRAKAQWFSEQFAKSWAEGGEAWSELKRLVDGLE